MRHGGDVGGGAGCTASVASLGDSPVLGGGRPGHGGSNIVASARPVFARRVPLADGERLTVLASCIRRARRAALTVACLASVGLGLAVAYAMASVGFGELSTPELGVLVGLLVLPLLTVWGWAADAFAAR